MAAELSPLPQGVTGPRLILEINDRLRRIAQGLGAGGGGVVGPAGPAGTGGTLNQVTVTTTPYDVLVSDDVVTFAAGSAVANLPDLSTIPRHEMTFINASAATVTLHAFAGDTIDGAATLALTPGARYQMIPDA
jgi:hypothetical protein